MRCSITHPPQSRDWSRLGKMARNLIRGVALMTAVAAGLPPPTFAQPKPLPAAQAGATEFNVEQLDAMLAPIALYPDDLLTQTLMASTYPLQVIAASRWLQEDNNKDLKGDALAKALESESWDPSVKSLVPFPQVGLDPAVAASGSEGRQPQDHPAAACRRAGRHCRHPACRSPDRL